jgi:hypothetical protein
LFEIPAVVGLGYDCASSEVIGQHTGHVVSGAEHERDAARPEHRCHVPGRLAVKVDVEQSGVEHLRLSQCEGLGPSRRRPDSHPAKVIEHGLDCHDQ